MSFFKSIGHALGKVSHAATSVAAGGVNFTSGLVGHIPVVGKPFHAAMDATIGGPLQTANAITGGARIDHAVVAGLKTQIKGVKDVAPYAKTVIGMVPGIGTTVNAGIGAGLALVNGQRIDKALLEGVKSALPPGVQDIYNKGVSIAATATSDNRSAIQSELDKLTGDAKKAFLVGTAMGHGARLQTAAQKIAASPAVQMIMQAAGATKSAANPVLASALQVISDPDVKHGFEVAIGTFDHDTPPAAIASLRGALSAKGQQGFDLALATHIGMLKKTPPSGVPPREQFGYFAIHGISGATPDQRTATLNNVAHDNSVRTGGDLAAKELNGNWFHHMLLKLHIAKAA